MIGLQLDVLLYVCAGVHCHPTLSQIGSASRKQDGSPSPSDTSLSTTTQDSSSTTEPQHTPANKSPSQKQHLDKPYSASMNHSKYGADRTGHEESAPSSQQPLAQPQGAKEDPSALSITMLSSDYSSFQQKTSVLKPSASSTASQPNGYPLKVSPGGAVTVPTGEMEPSEQSFESSIASSNEEYAQASIRSPPLFQDVTSSDLIGEASATAQLRDSRTADVSVSDMTESDVQELTSTTSKSMSSAVGGNDSSGSSSASAGDSSGVGGSLRPPIKGILKHPAERRTQSSSAVAPSAPTRRGKGKAIPMTTE